VAFGAVIRLNPFFANCRGDVPDDSFCGFLIVLYEVSLRAAILLERTFREETKDTFAKL